MLLDGKVALITGAAQGQGRAAAVGFAEEGAKVVITDIDGTGLAQTEELVKEVGGTVLAVTADLARLGDIRSLIDATSAAHDSLDVLYNNAGVVGGGTIESYDEAAWDTIYAVNAKAVFFLVQAALPLLRKSSGAMILMISTTAVEAGVAGCTVYGSAKAALLGMTRNMAVELADDGIRVNCLLPGIIDTPMTTSYLDGFPEEEREKIRAGWFDPQLFKRFGKPEEVVAMAAFLASDRASFITGAVIPVDGGWLSS